MGGDHKGWPAVLRRPDILGALGTIDYPDRFTARLAEETGGDLPDAYHGLLPETAPLAGWIPSDAQAEGGLQGAGWRIPLVWAGEHPFSQPFVSEDLARWRCQPLSQAVQPWLDLPGLILRGEALGGPPPAGLIFHISRCGSTLLSRMLGSMAGVTALSEPPPLEAMIAAHRQDPAMDETVQLRAIRAMAALLCRNRDTAPGRGAIIKLDSWSLLDFDRLRAAFPDVPFVVLHRDPLAVMASHRRRVGFQMAGDVGWRPDPPLAHRGEHAPRLLGDLCEAGARAVKTAGGRSLAYETLIDMDVGAIPGLFGLTPTVDDRQAMEAARRGDAKEPGEIFRPEAAAGVGDADADMTALADRWARPAWRRLAALG